MEIRIDHVLYHAKDDPLRLGNHGVFDGGSDSVLAVIDEAYIRAQTPGPHVTVKVEGNRTVYDVDMERRIGFVGGQGGAKIGNPEVTRIRLVLKGNEVITACPIQ